MLGCAAFCLASEGFHLKHLLLCQHCHSGGEHRWHARQPGWSGAFCCDSKLLPFQPLPARPVTESFRTTPAPQCQPEPRALSSNMDSEGLAVRAHEQLAAQFRFAVRPRLRRISMFSYVGCRCQTWHCLWFVIVRHAQREGPRIGPGSEALREGRADRPGSDAIGRQQTNTSAVNVFATARISIRFYKHKSYKR